MAIPVLCLLFWQIYRIEISKSWAEWKEPRIAFCSFLHAESRWSRKCFKMETYQIRQTQRNEKLQEREEKGMKKKQGENQVRHLGFYPPDFRSGDFFSTHLSTVCLLFPFRWSQWCSHRHWGGAVWMRKEMFSSFHQRHDSEVMKLSESKSKRIPACWKGKSTFSDVLLGIIALRGWNGHSTFLECASRVSSDIFTELQSVSTSVKLLNKNSYWCDRKSKWRYPDRKQPERQQTTKGSGVSCNTMV